MSKVYADKIEPRDSGTDVTIGTSSNTVTLAGNIIQGANTVKDSGGNTLWVSDGAGGISSGNIALTGSLKLLQTQTVTSGVATVAFTTGINSDYDAYCFKYMDVNIATNDQRLAFQVNAPGNRGYRETITSTSFNTLHSEADDTGFEYRTSEEQNQGTDEQPITLNQTNAADAAAAGELWLFKPSGTTYVKHFISDSTCMGVHSGSACASRMFAAGYVNMTAAITMLQFRVFSGEIDTGTFKMYGLL